MSRASPVGARQLTILLHLFDALLEFVKDGIPQVVVFRHAAVEEALDLAIGIDGELAAGRFKEARKEHDKTHLSGRPCMVISIE